MLEHAVQLPAVEFLIVGVESEFGIGAGQEALGTFEKHRCGAGVFNLMRRLDACSGGSISWGWSGAPTNERFGQAAHAREAGKKFHVRRAGVVKYQGAMGDIMPAAAIADRLSFSSESGRALVDRFWPWSRRAKNSKAVVAPDHAEQRIVNARDDQSVVAPLMARIDTLEAELAKVEAAAAVHRADFAKVEAAAAIHRADFERERERCERLMAEVLKTTADLMAAREATSRIAGELAAIRARPWWRRLAG